MRESRRRLVVGIGLLGVAVGGWILRRWLGRLADPVGLAIRAAMILGLAAASVAELRPWWAQLHGRWTPPPLSESESFPRSLLPPVPPPLWQPPTLVISTWLAFLLLVTGHSVWLVVFMWWGPVICGLMWERRRQAPSDRARWRAEEARWHTQVRERHERALAAGAGAALPRRIAKLRPDLVRECPACAEMYALWDTNRKISFTQAEAIVERQIVLGRCPPHAACRDK